MWQKAMALVASVYGLTKTFPRDEIYALTSQTRKAAVSVPANIAEGQGRRLSGEFHQFLANSRGSLMKLDTHLEVACLVSYLSEAQLKSIQNDLNE